MSFCRVLWCAKYRQDWFNPHHQHNYKQLLMVAGGHGAIELADERVMLKQGSLVFIRPGLHHAIHSSEEDPLQLFDVKFTLSDAELREHLKTRWVHLEETNYQWYKGKFEKMIKEGEQQGLFYHSLICHTLDEMLIRFVRGQAIQSVELVPQRSELVSEAREDRGDPVSTLLRYIELNYTDAINLDDLSRIVNLNKTSLAQQFKERTGTTPIRYINQLRLTKAKELLGFSSAGIGEIAELIGFQSIHYFSRYFKEKEGCTPLEYREKTMQSRFFTFDLEGIEL